MSVQNSEYILNYGPHHPSTHGIMRLILTLQGEKILACSPEIGYLHRGVEKLVENRSFLSIIPYVDRLDYLAPVIQEHAYVRAIEKLLNINVPRRALIIRTIFDELTRISSHIMAIGCLTYDLGCLSLFLYGFEEREKIMDIFEATTGARMHLAYYVPGGVTDDVSNETLNAIKLFLNKLRFYMDAVRKLALDNRIFQQRTKGIGIISKETAIKNGISGINLRASGEAYDVRKSMRYGVYSELTFEPITLLEGDCYARNMLRFLEIEQSIKLIKQCLNLIEPGEICSYDCFSRDIKLPKNSVIYSSTETPRGEFGIHLFTEEEQTKPYRLRFRSPSFATIQLLKTLIVGHSIPDIPAILGSLDFIMGCCDR
ncbi:MAG: NADH-quinone oxidoreductase subunit D [Alphaproteobacteria bacterium]|nr:NADH-quinone oxidoreductase subunit D [Alphaproteobacteria bacterium]